jgi:hypothetical protein
MKAEILIALYQRDEGKDITAAAVREYRFGPGRWSMGARRGARGALAPPPVENRKKF